MRLRILVPFILLLAIAAVLPLFALQQTLLNGLKVAIDNDLRQEMLELDQLLTDGRDPATGQRFTSLEALFDVYFARNVPSREEAFLGFVDGELYRSSTLTRFPLDRLPAEELAAWENLGGNLLGDEGSSTGTFQTALGEAYFRAARIHFEHDVGAFVVTILPADEQEAIAQFLRYGGIASSLVLVVASVGAWLVAGRVLEPVRLLTETAHSISQSDLTARIDVRGTGEAADMARSFNAMLDRLEAVFQGQRDFIQDANHELRDPITVVRSYVELWDDDPAGREKTVRLVLDELDRMRRIVDDLRLLAEVDQPGFLRLDWIDGADFTDELLSKVRTLAPRNWQVDHSGSGGFFADRHRLTEAVMNLAHNAVQHTEEHAMIALGVRIGGGRDVQITVRDTGPGIPLSEQAVVFDRFARGSGAQVRYGGSGLGLTIVKAIAEAHGGHVELESRLGEGSAFTIVVAGEQEEVALWPGS